jgi:LysM repeat protein
MPKLKVSVLNKSWCVWQVKNYSGTLISLQEAKEKINAKAIAASQIEVKDGDNIWSIAQERQVSAAELQKLNPQLDKQLRIYPGDKLTIKAEKTSSHHRGGNLS